MTEMKTHPALTVFFRLLTVAVFFATFSFFGHQNQTSSLNLTGVSDTLSTSRFSFVGRLASGNSAGSGLVTLDTSPNTYESTSSANLFVNDSVGIGDSTGISTYTVSDIISASQFQISTSLGSGDADAGDFVIATRSATHTVAFTTTTAIPNGAIRILIPTVSTDANATDGIPDRNGFDFSFTANASFPVTCPADSGSTYDFVAGTATKSAVTVGSTKYHAFECRYSGNGASSTSFTGFVIGNGSTALINPAPNSAHVEGTADSYTYIIQNLDSANNVVDQTTGAVAVIESVRVTATVDPQITFRIMGVSTGTTTCGVATTVTTTSTAVPLGTLSIGSFTSAAQALSVSTNASSGYAVTAIANDQLGKDGNTCTGGGPTFSNPCIPDSAGDNAAMSHSAIDKWDSTSTKGFAYSLQDPNGTVTEAFAYNTGTGNCSGASFCSKQFADNENSEVAQTLFSDTTVADNDNIYVCYRAVISASQQAADYTSNITYRATATF